MVIKPIDAAILDAYHRYGQKLYIVLSTAIKIAKLNRMKSLELPGDFEHRALVEELEKQNFKYNPSMLLRVLEREYSIIETTYKTSNQHWYRFKDLGEVERALNMVMGIATDVEDPDVAMLKIQLKSLQISYWVKKLKNMSIKGSLSSADVKIFRKFAFDVLPKLIRILKKAEEYEDKLYVEINLLKELISLASIIADRIDIGKSTEDIGINITLGKYVEDIITNE